AGEFERLENGDDFFDARDRGQRGIAHHVFFPDDADDRALDPTAHIGAQTHLVDAVDDVIDLFLCGMRLDDDNHVTGSLRGYEPSSSNRTALRSISASIRFVRASAACPSNSRKKTYPTSGALRGNDSIQVRLMLFLRKAVRASASDPGLC